jgi:tetratricopeptide (TPR) repeat protein
MARRASLLRASARVRASLAIALCVAVVACGSRDAEQADGVKADLAPITVPDLARVDPPVQAQIKERYASVSKLEASGNSPARDLGTAYGEYGMLLHAAEYHEAARPAYLNAQALVPDDPRWPYYLAQLYRTEGNTTAAMASFRRLLELRPDDVSSLVWLGRMYLDQGEPDQAEPLFAKAQASNSQVVAAQVGLGQVALARKDYHRAVQLLEASLAVDPSAASIYSPLAQAYRGLGQTEKAESLASQWKNTELTVPDPLRQELDVVLRSGLSYELRGVRALDARDYTGAVGLFRQGLVLTKPGTLLHRSLRHKLGTALALSGDIQGAIGQFEETVRDAPRDARDEPAAKASYSLGILLAGEGRYPEAAKNLTAALRYNPNYLEARMALGDVLRDTGRAQAALEQYVEVVRLDPRAAEARINYAVALASLGRYADARVWLEEAVRAQPDRPELANALARILAAAPVPAVRDGQRALAIAQELAKTSSNPELGETMAMALAEVGSFGDAISLQRDVIAAARQAGMDAEVRRMGETLRLYESGRPSRTPWPAEPVGSAGRR